MKCYRKRRYDSREEAEAALNVVGPLYRDFTMTPYSCDRCGFWHIGHKDPTDKQRAIDRKALERRLQQLAHARRPSRVKERERILQILRDDRRGRTLQ